MNTYLHPQKLPQNRFRRVLRYLTYFVALLALSFVILLAAASRYERTHGGACASCHEIWQPYSDWHTSAHRSVPCTDCHGDVFTLNAGFHINNMRRVFTHLSGDVAERPRLRVQDVLQMVPRCQKCHEQEFADWQASAHSASYSDIFLNTDHNHRQLLMDDCLRCHGMHFQGGIRNLVTPLATSGPWQLKLAALNAQPVIPCLTCHEIHHVGAPMEKATPQHPTSSSAQEINRPSVSLFDRRELQHVSLADLPLPAKMFDGAREVHISPDHRQALCYQCHAPTATLQVRSGDDRTPTGVHEGLSCLSCHDTHNQQTRASCATCHPKLSNCGIAVETMDTTFKSTKSLHNIHSVKCTDCHSHGIPKKKPSVISGQF